MPRSNENLQRRIAVHFSGSAEIRERFIQGTTDTMLMGARACNMAASKEKAFDHGIVDDGLQYHTHEARLSHVVETPRESKPTRQRRRLRCNGLIPFATRI